MRQEVSRFERDRVVFEQTIVRTKKVKREEGAAQRDKPATVFDIYQEAPLKLTLTDFYRHGDLIQRYLVLKLIMAPIVKPRQPLKDDASSDKKQKKQFKHLSEEDRSESLRIQTYLLH